MDSRLRAAAGTTLIALLLTGCLPQPSVGPPSFTAFLGRNGLAFRPSSPPLAPEPAAIIAEVRREQPVGDALPGKPTYGRLSCPVRCSAVLELPGETLGMWFVPFPATAYGDRDMAWILADTSGQVFVVSTQDNP